MTTAQKIGVAFTLILVVCYFSYITYRDGGFDSLGQRFLSVPAMVPVNSTTLSASFSPEASLLPMDSPTIVASASLPRSSQSRLHDVLVAMNAHRAVAGAGSLRTHPVLVSLAQTHADDMATKAYFSHTSPSGVTFEQRISISKYGGTSSAENIGLTSSDAIAIIDGWMDSTGHRVNMLNEDYASVGIGIAGGVWQGMPVSFVVAVFGSEK